MITLEQATQIAHARNKDYNGLEEYEDAWYFFLDDGITRTGGDTGIVVLKESGETMIFHQYITKGCYMTEEEEKEQDFNAMLDIAESRRKGIDRYIEYKDAYKFYGSKDSDSEGGYDQPIIVMKESFDDYIMIGLIRNNLADVVAEENKVSEGSIEMVCETDKEFNGYYHKVVEETIKKYE